MSKNRKRLVNLCLCTVLLVALGPAPLSTAETASRADSVEEIKQVVEGAYIQGVHANFSAEAMRRGFHADFVMKILTDEGVLSISRDQWIERMAAAQQTRSERARPRIDHRFVVVDVTGTAAVVKVEVDRGGEHVFTDYLSLYRFDDGWKIVAKTFFRHPSN